MLGSLRKKVSVSKVYKPEDVSSVRNSNRIKKNIISLVFYELVGGRVTLPNPGNIFWCVTVVPSKSGVGCTQYRKKLRPDKRSRLKRSAFLRPQNIYT